MTAPAPPPRDFSVRHIIRDGRIVDFEVHFDVDASAATARPIAILPNSRICTCKL